MKASQKCAVDAHDMANVIAKLFGLRSICPGSVIIGAYQESIPVASQRWQGTAKIAIRKDVFLHLEKIVAKFDFGRCDLDSLFID